MPPVRLPEPSVRLLRTIALVLAGLCLGYLVFGPKPWVDGTAAAESAGERLRVAHYRVTGLWFGALANLLLISGVFAMAPWFMRQLAEKATAPLSGASERTGRWPLVIFCTTAAAMLIGATGSVPRMGYGLWVDEDKAARNLTIGEFQRSKTSGEFAFREVTWEETSFGYRLPNHVFFSQCARLAHTLFPPSVGAEHDFINEAALRLPSLLGGLLGLGAIALLLSELGLRRAALIAPLILAVHPWYLRYSSEARGYGMVFFLGPLTAWLLLVSIRNGRWRCWIGYAVLQFILVYTLLHTLFLLLFLNIAAMVWIWRSGRARAALFRRWVLSNCVTLGLGLALMLPLAPQLISYVDEIGSMPASKKFEFFAKDNGSAFISGVRYQQFEDHHAPSFKKLLEDDNPVGSGLLLLAVVSAAIAGFVHLARAGPGGWVLLGFLLLPAPAFVLNAWLSKTLTFYWYTVIALPLFWALVATGAGTFAGWIERRYWRSAGAAPALAVGAALALLLFWVSFPQRKFLLSRPIEWTHESVAATRSIVDPLAPGYDQVLVIGFDRRFAYDGAKHRATDLASFEEWLRKADATGTPLFVNYLAVKSTRTGFPEIVATVENSEYFELVKLFPGTDPGTDRVVRKYIGGSYPAISPAAD